MSVYDSINESLLVDGAVGIMPTDTLYGLVARAHDQKAVNRLYGLKSRLSKPGTLIAADVNQLIDLGLDRKFIKQAEKFWPGPVSVILPFEGTDFAYLHQDFGSIAARIVNHPQLLALLKRTGPLLTSSANAPGLPPAGDVLQAKQYFADSVDFYIDGGDLSGRTASKIIKIDQYGEVTVIR